MTNEQFEKYKRIILLSDMGKVYVNDVVLNQDGDIDIKFNIIPDEYVLNKFKNDMQKELGTSVSFSTNSKEIEERMKLKPQPQPKPETN